ncbi:DUF4885 domain-containing protein [Lysinibacillus piscis]|uniref:DUF4885 domain-containing protein n=1 Tax=Lysinibacillus piscis TaxID=2518931 RepID=A0ABQ5NFH6_9BACI|nr:DUF4885 domain-containing protein [Lysinibacillus sp. KH24]GLC87130.1 hypothetical protein LYSBPC_02570 [Lysinibacillus sp. KH24]
MNISASTPFVPTNTSTKTTPINKDTTVIQSRNEYESEKDRQVRLHHEYYQKVNAQNKMFQYPEQHIFDKYHNRSSPYYRHDLTTQERDAAASTELSFLKWGHAGSVSFSDPFFRGKSFYDDVEVASQKAFNRQKVNGQFQQLLNQHQLTIPKDAKLTFTIDPNTYKVGISGTEDSELARMLEEALNSANNAKQLFAHIIKSRSDDSTQFTQKKYDKYNLVREIQNVTGYNLKDLQVVDNKFVTQDGTNILDIYQNHLKNNPYVSDWERGVRNSHYGSQLTELAKQGFDSIPDLILSIDYENGSFHDVGQRESYGTGKTDWIAQLHSSK